MHDRNDAISREQRGEFLRSDAVTVKALEQRGSYQYDSGARTRQTLVDLPNEGGTQGHVHLTEPDRHIEAGQEVVKIQRRTLAVVPGMAKEQVTLRCRSLSEPHDLFANRVEGLVLPN